jgi:diguanylate cyclase (GGDEF)-like protein
MQDLLKKYLPHFLLLLLVAVTVLVWLLVFPTETRLDTNGVLFESIYLIISFICFYLIGFYYSPGKTRSESRNSDSIRHELDHMAHHDILTGLPNRILFTDRLHQAIASAKRKDELLAIHFIGLDNFRDINDSLGHDCGDQVLKEAACRLGTCVRDTDTIARWSGDEFAVIQTNIRTIDDAEIVAKKMIDGLSKKIELARKEIQLTISIGIALYPLDTINFDELLIKADKSMYKAKDISGSAFDVFNHSES